jgi:hypothetical protein
MDAHAADAPNHPVVRRLRPAPLLPGIEAPLRTLLAGGTGIFGAARSRATGFGPPVLGGGTLWLFVAVSSLAVQALTGNL